MHSKRYWTFARRGRLGEVHSVRPEIVRLRSVCSPVFGRSSGVGRGGILRRRKCRSRRNGRGARSRRPWHSPGSRAVPNAQHCSLEVNDSHALSFLQQVRGHVKKELSRIHLRKWIVKQLQGKNNACCGNPDRVDPVSPFISAQRPRMAAIAGSSCPGVNHARGRLFSEISSGWAAADTTATEQTSLCIDSAAGTSTRVQSSGALTGILLSINQTTD